MKKTILLLSGLLALNFSAVSCDDDREDEIVITQNQLPETAKVFLSTHFSGISILRIEKEAVADSDGTIYEVKLANGFQVDFDINGNWTGVDGNGQQLSGSVVALIPANILQYLATHHTPFTITEIEKKSYGYEIEINDRVELRFNTQGNIL